MVRDGASATFLSTTLFGVPLFQWYNDPHVRDCVSNANPEKDKPFEQEQRYYCVQERLAAILQDDSE